jgi:hypothetical protein
LRFDTPNCVRERRAKEGGVTLGDQAAMPRRMEHDLHASRSAVSLKPHHGVDAPLESRGHAFDRGLRSGPNSIGDDGVVGMKDDVHELTLRVWLG